MKAKRHHMQNDLPRVKVEACGKTISMEAMAKLQGFSLQQKLHFQRVQRYLFRKKDWSYRFARYFLHEFSTRRAKYFHYQVQLVNIYERVMEKAQGNTQQIMHRLV